MAVIPIIPTLFETTIEPHLSALHAYCISLTGNRQDGEDLYQTTLEKAYRSFTDQSVMKRAYLFRIAKNAWIDGIRKKSVPQTPLIDEQLADTDHPNLHLREAFEVMAEHLTVRQCVLLLLVDIFGFTAKETASYIDSTEGAVKEALKRARLRLARLALESDAYSPKARRSTSNDNMNQELMDLFIEAFRSGNVYRIYNSYRNLRSSGLDVARVRKQETALYFDFHDPNGHLIRICSKNYFE